MLISFTPKCAQGDDRQYEGMAKFRLMTVDEKYAMAGELQTLNEKEGPIKALLKGLDLVEPLIEFCEFKNLESGDEYKDFKSLRADCRNDEICQEMAAFVMQGYRVPKNSKA